MGGNNANLLEDFRTTKKNLTISSEAIFSAHTTFTSHYNTFLSLAEQFENKFKELEEREAAVEKRENEVVEKTQQLENREKKCVEREQNVGVREQKVTTKEAQWVETEKKMQENVANFPSIIKFNISGTKYYVSKEKLLKYKGSLFEQLLATGHPQQLPSSNKIFVERDPKYFHYLLRFINNGGVLTSPTSIAKREAIEQEFAYFQIQLKFHTPDFIHTRVATNELVDGNKFGAKIKEWLPNKRFQLLYKASVDGFGATDFHRLCDNKGPTLTVIRSNAGNGYLFGGYTPLSWDSATNNYKQNAEGFVFTLTNPHNIPPTKYLCHKSQYAINCNTSYGPTFGGGHDIHISDQSNQNNSSYSRLSHSYTDTTGKGENTFTGARNFTTSEIEVYSVL